MLYNLIIAPIETIVDWVFVFFCDNFKMLGVIGAVVGVSLAINFLALPLYNIADSLQEKERKIAKKLEYRTKRIKKAFKGDEQFMMLSTYYKQNNYHPLYVLRSSLSILIEIPFFIAAYHYLNNCEILKGSSFWIFKDLGSPDGLLHIGNFPIHVLPIIMTVINFISGAIYTKDATFREKAQLYVVATIFLILLYSSPSGLVIYWILNNLFSLIKNIVMKASHPGRILHASISIILLCLSLFFIMHDGAAWKKAIVLTFSCVVTILPVLKKQLPVSKYPVTAEKDSIIPLLVSGIGLTLLVGFLLPTNIISTSPIEFSFLGSTDSPLNYIKNSIFISAGFFIFWPICIYKMFGKKIGKAETIIFVLLFFCSLANAFIFKFNYGVLDTTLTLEETSVLKDISTVNKILPFVFILLISTVYIALSRLKKLQFINIFMIAICIAEIGVGIPKISHIKKIYQNYANTIDTSNPKSDLQIEPVYHLSKNGKNVAILFLDRAIGTFLPYALEEIPELKNQLQGFVYYPNTLSFSSNTDLASPSMMAGYEYTPEKINERSSELLRDKHNEASLVMPTLFTNANYEATITDPPCPNYTWKGDLSNFKKNENIHAYELFGKYTASLREELGLTNKNNQDTIVKKELINFSILEILPPIFRNTFYGNFRTSYNEDESFLNMISCLYYLKKLTDFNTDKNQFIFIDNETPHQPTILSNDFLTPCNEFAANITKYKTKDQDVLEHYNAFVATFKQIGLWFDFLRENNVFDNTRIIIVSDHGRNINLRDFSDFKNPKTPSSYNATLLVKDFYSNKDFSSDNTFMTNADTIFLATENLNISRINPFTHNDLKQEKKNGINVYFVAGTEWNPEQMVDKTQFTLDKSTAFHVSSDIFEKNNWIPLTEWEKTNGGNN